MFCVYCGNHMHDHHRFCSKCGKPRDSVVPPQAPPAIKPEPPREDGGIQTVDLASKALEGVAAMLEQGGCADVRSCSSNSKRTVTLTGSSSFDAKFSTRFEHWPENWSKCATYEDPTFMDYLKKFVGAFLVADWTRPEESLLENLSFSKAATSCSRKDEASGTGFVQFDIAITPEGSGGRYTGRISFEEKTFLEHLRVLEEKQEQAAREEAERQAAIAKAAAVVDEEIGSIGAVSLYSKGKLKAAREAYEILTEEQKTAVTMLHVLENAEAELAELEAKAQEEEAARIAAAEQARLTEARKVEADRAHQRDDSLERFEIPDGATRVGDFAFRGCRRLKELIIPESVRVIGLGAFAGCRSLEKISFPDHLDEIRERAFFGCSSLTEINLPDNLKRIGAGAFLGCSSLKSVGGSPISAEVADDAFNGCPLPGKPNTHPTSVKISPHKRVGENRRGLDEKDHWADSFDFDDGYAHL